MTKTLAQLEILNFDVLYKSEYNARIFQSKDCFWESLERRKRKFLEILDSCKKKNFILTSKIRRKLRQLKLDS